MCAYTTTPLPHKPLDNLPITIAYIGRYCCAYNGESTFQVLVGFGLLVWTQNLHLSFGIIN